MDKFASPGSDVESKPDSVPEEGIPQRRTGTWLTASAHIITAVIGAGILALPSALGTLGWVAGPLLLLCIGALTQLCSALLADCYLMGDPPQPQPTLTAMVRTAFGAWGFHTVGIFQHASLITVTLSYGIAAPQSLQAIARSVCAQHNTSSCFDDYNVWALIFGGTQLVMAQLPSIDHLWVSSLFGAAMSFTYSLIALGLSVGTSDKGGGSVGGVPYGSPSGKAFAALDALGTILFAFNFSVQLVEIQNTIRLDAKPGPVAHMRRAISISTLIMTAFYLAVSCAGYAAFGDAVPSNIITAFSSPAWLVNLANAAVVAHLGPAYQICLQPFALYVEAHYTAWAAAPAWSKGWVLRLWLRSACVCLVTFFAVLLPFFGPIIGLSGALSYWPPTVAFPVEMWIRLRRPSRRVVLALRLVSAVSFLLTAAALVGSVRDIVVAASTWHVFSGNDER